MAELKDITEHTTGLCAATLAYATATATTVGTVAALGPIAVPVLTLAAIGLSAWHSKKLHCVDRAMKSVLADMRKSGTIAPAMIDRTLLILSEAPPASITAAELAEAAKTTDVHSAVATLLLSRFPKANDDPEARALIETALASGIRALRSDPQFHLEFTQEVLIDLASAQGIQLQHLRAIQVNTDQIPEILRRLGGIENILANPEALSLKDLTDLAARFGEHSATTRESRSCF